MKFTKSDLRRMIKEQLMKESYERDIEDGFNDMLDEMELHMGMFDYGYDEGQIDQASYKQITKAYDTAVKHMKLYVKLAERLREKIE